VDARWKDVRAAAVAGRWLGTWAPDVASQGSVTFSGALTPFSLTAEGAGALAAAAAVPPATWSAELEHGASTAAALQLAQGVQNRASARLARDASGALAGGVALDLSDFTAAAVLFGVVPPGATVGALHAEAELSGTVAAPAATVSVQGRDVAILGSAAEHVDAVGHADREAVTVEALRIRMGQGEIEAQGRIGLAAPTDSRWRLRVAELRVSAAREIVARLTGTRLPISHGRISAALEGSGRPAAPAVDGEIALSKCRLAGEPFETIAADVSVAWPEWRGEASFLHTPAERLEIAAAGRGAVAAELRLHSGEWQLDRLRRDTRGGLGGIAALRASLRGPLDALDGEASVEGRDLTWEGRPLGALRAQARAARGVWEIDAHGLGDTVDLAVTLGAQPAWPARVALRWREADLAPLLTGDEQTRVVSSGSLELSGPLHQPDRVAGRGRIERAHLHRGAHQFATRAPVDLHVERGALRVAEFTVEGTETQMTARATAALDGSFAVHVDGYADLVLAEVFAAAVRGAAGRVEFTGAVSRSAAGAIALVGRGALQNASLDVDAPVAFTETTGRFTLRNRVVTIDALDGRAGGGTFTVRGQVDLDAGPELTWTVRELNTGALEWLEHEVSGDGRVRGTWQELLVEGRLEVLQALYAERIRLTQLIPWFRKKRGGPKQAEAAPGRRVRLDLRIVAPGSIYVENNYAKAELSVDLHIGGTTDAVQLDGPIEVTSGEVTFRRRVFEITSGVIEFRRELGRDAALNISAETVVPTRDLTYTVYVQIVGTTDDYRVLLTGDDPALSQTDLASLIAFGRTAAQPQDGRGFGTEDLVAVGAGVYKEDVERGLRDLLLVDRFEIEPAFSQTTGAFEPRVTVGKNLTDTLSGAVSGTFGVEQQRSVLLEYRLTPRISLQGLWESETDTEEGAFGGGVKVRYQFRRFPRFSLLRGCCRRDETDAR
jgi:autotransporter translocation and assembly factor TamB